MEVDDDIIYVVAIEIHSPQPGQQERKTDLPIQVYIKEGFKCKVRQE